VSNLFFVSQMLHTNFGGNFFVKLIGDWQATEYGGHTMPVGGLC
jgi:protein transport protein SEC61 subunit alpha